MIRRNDLVRGLQLRDSSLKIVQFADDSTCFLSHNSSLKPLIELLNTFKGWSRLRINKAKSKILSLQEESRYRPISTPSR